MEFILYVNGYSSESGGFNHDNINEFSSFGFNSLEECIEFIQTHRNHTRGTPECTYGYEIIDLRGAKE